MISVLNKALCWAYEQEWRLVILNETLLRKTEKYLRLSRIIQAKSITLGQSFLDNFIPELSKTNVEESFSQLMDLTSCANSKNIPLFQIIPTQNSFDQSNRILLQCNDLQSFVNINQLEQNFTLPYRGFLYTSYWQHLGISKTE